MRFIDTALTAPDLRPGAFSFDRLRAADPSPQSQQVFESALQCHLAGRLEHAIALYNQALSLDPHYPEAHNNLAAALVSQSRFPEAIARYERAISLRPDYVDAHNNLAVALMATGRVLEALICYARVLVFEPHNADAHYNVGIAMAQLGRFFDARASYRFALRLDPRHADAHNNLANLLCRDNDYEAALLHYNKALSINPLHAWAHNNVASLHRDLGRFSEALAHYDRALELDPALAEAHYNRADIVTFEPNASRLAALRRLAAKADLPSDDAVFIHFALAKALDDTQDYSGAFEHLRAGNRLKRQQLHYDEQSTAAWFRALAQEFSQCLLDRFRGTGDPSETPVFVVGMPRSGTSLVEQILASHPLIHGAGELEFLARVAPQPFPATVSAMRAEEFAGIGRAYLRALPTVTNKEVRIVDKLPQNFLYIGLIRLILPNARIVHVTRNPVDTCMSSYSRLFTSGQEFSYDLAELGRYYRLYEGFMDHWRSVLPAGAMLEVSYEALVNDMETETGRILDYCDVPWDARCLSFHRTERPVRTASAAQVRRPLFRTSLDRARAYRSVLGPLLAELDR